MACTLAVDATSSLIGAALSGVELQVSQRAHLLPAPGWNSRVRLAHLRRDTQY